MQTSAESLEANDLQDAWPFLDADERLEGFRLLAPGEAEGFFVALDARDQCELLLATFTAPSASSGCGSSRRTTPPTSCRRLPEEQREALLGAARRDRRAARSRRCSPTPRTTPAA